jgi:hypothetical protein
VERQQLKRFAFGAALFLGASLFPFSAGENMSGWVIFAVLMTGLLGMPVAVGIAILRHRLYDIDILINRTLVYGSLTMLLVLVYFGGVVVLQRLFVLLSGQVSTIAVVASTLLIAALFSPLRRRIQSFVDRRFYRGKYDAQKTLQAFSSRLRDETDLNALSYDLVGVVRETMQPAHVSLWLRPDRGPKKSRGSRDLRD